MYQKILVPVDGSSTSERGLEEAIRLGSLTHGRLRLLHVVDELSLALAMDAYSGYAGDWMNTLRQEGRRILEDAKARVIAAGLEAETVLYDNAEGRVHDLTIDDAKKWPADVIVIGTHGRRGIGRMVLGSNAEHVLRLSPAPVLLVRATEPAATTKLDERDGSPLRVHLPTGALAIE
ncbi:universal stress protein [Variovorax guangxiensis]|uniref:Universal stress protein n=1 Tax=Variovorax guangxiensis TaxID=1775474 RepID=A0A502DDE2_9BURK|nr:universal stress protein [Variovorax guangxiensis]RZI66521.1 MAG: universal stress protein [Variovorax sp.]TPG17691.1 universal stress protein [Variovorax ginsengisoli]TPG23605.1 universal stress protein [Variovorax guangxiensis]